MSVSTVTMVATGVRWRFGREGAFVSSVAGVGAVDFAMQHAQAPTEVDWQQHESAQVISVSVAHGAVPPHA